MCFWNFGFGNEFKSLCDLWLQFLCEIFKWKDVSKINTEFDMSEKMKSLQNVETFSSI